MPSTYAHYCFGKAVYRRLPQEIQEEIKAYSPLYMTGLHGPDILFYYKPLKSNDINRIGYGMHGRPADEISVGDVLRVLEGSLEAAACPGIENDGTCHGSDVCVAKLVWKRINDSITSAVDTLMLGQLIEESRRVHEEKMESQGMEENVPDILK